MIHHCPQCEDEARANKGHYEYLETYNCDRCLDGYCVHFMKHISPERVCWICGSEKLVPMFESLLDRWRNDTRHHSNSSFTHSHPAYIALLAIGKPAISLIVKDIKMGAQCHWFHAVRHILGDSPTIPEQYAGRIAIMEEIYLKWLEQRGYK